MATRSIVVGAVAAAVAFGAVMLLSDTDARAPGVVSAARPGTAGLAVFHRMGCGSCHRLAAAGSNGALGPNLDDRLQSHTAESLKAQITAPDPTRMMPTDFARRMTATELDALVSFLLAARR